MSRKYGEIIMKNILKTALAFAVATTLWAQTGKIAPDLSQMDSKAKVDVIVRYAKGYEGTAGHKVNKAGGIKKRNHSAIRSATFSMSVGQAKKLASDPAVEYISPDRGVNPTLDYTAPSVFADIAQSYGWNGAGVGVAVIDSGIGLHPDLSGRVVYSESFVAKKSTDRYGHGTHVAGILAGDGSAVPTASKVRFVGIAPKANLIDLQVLDENGAGSDSGVIAAIERAIELKDTYNIRVINLSLGRPVYESFLVDPLCQAVEAAWNAGIVVVVAAGNEGRDNSMQNEGYATIGSPANHPAVITVGAMKTNSTSSRADDTIASYSSKGPSLLDHVVKPDLVAPGNRIVSALAGNFTQLVSNSQTLLPLSYYSSASGNGQTSSLYYRLSGTSMATPVVSGAAALLLQKEPYLKPDQVKARLMLTASKAFPTSSTVTDPDTGATFTNQYDIFTIGAGYLDIQAAIASNDVAPDESSARSPIAYYDSKTDSVLISNEPSEVCGYSALWGRSTVCDYSMASSILSWFGMPSVWSNTAIWGRTAVWGRTAIWGRTAVWGDSVFLSGSSALWGRTAVWGRSSVITSSTALWGRSALWGRTAVWGRSGAILNAEN